MTEGKTSIDVSEDQAKKVFSYLGKKHGCVFKLKLIDIIDDDGKREREKEERKQYIICAYQFKFSYTYLAGMSSFWQNKWIFLEFSSNEQHKWQDALAKMMEINAEFNIGFPRSYSLVPENIVVLKKGTTLEQILIELDLSCLEI